MLTYYRKRICKSYPKRNTIEYWWYKATDGTPDSACTENSAQQASLEGGTGNTIASDEKHIGTIVDDPLVFEEFVGLVVGENETGGLTVQQRLYDKTKEPLLAEIFPVTNQENTRAIRQSDHVRKDTELIYK